MLIALTGLALCCPGAGLSVANCYRNSSSESSIRGVVVSRSLAVLFLKVWSGVELERWCAAWFEIEWSASISISLFICVVGLLIAQTLMSSCIGLLKELNGLLIFKGNV